MPPPPSDELPAEGAAPLDADWDNVYDGEARRRRQLASMGSGGRADFDRRPVGHRRPGRWRVSLREHLGEQVRLTFDDPRGPADRGADAGAGRRRRPPAGGRTPRIAAAMGCEEALRRRGARAACSASTRSACSAATCANAWRCSSPDRNRLDPCDGGAARQPRHAGAARPARADARSAASTAEDLADMIAEIKRLDPKPGASYDAPPAAGRGAGRADAPRPGWRLGAGAEPGDPAARAGQPRLPRPRRGRRPQSKDDQRLPGRAPAERELAGEVAGAARQHHPEGRRPRSSAGRTASSATASDICAR